MSSATLPSMMDSYQLRELPAGALGIQVTTDVFLYYCLEYISYCFISSHYFFTLKSWRRFVSVRYR